MPRERADRHIEKFKTRHGTIIYYFRVGKGARIRLPDDPASPAFKREYNKALMAHLAGTLKERNEKTLGWLIDQYRESQQYAELAKETRKQFKYQLARMKAKAAEAPLAELTEQSIVEGREALQRRWDSFGRNGTAGITVRSLMKWSGQAGATVGAPVASADDFDVIEDTPEEKAAAKVRASRFTFIPVGEVVKLPSPGWVIKGLIPWAELGIVYGPSGSGKSFVMIDLCMAIARGVPWRGLKVRQGKVRYIVAEGRGGFRKRLRAYGMHHGIDLDQVPMSVMETAPNFLMNDDVKAVAAAVKASEGADVIVVDTFAKVTPGANENAGEDMGKAIDNCRRLHEVTGALVILVHHTGKDVERGARGWSGIRAAADFEAEVCRDEASGKRWLQITKQKDGDDDGRWGFKLVDVVVGLDEDDDPVTSCVLGDDEVPEMGKAPRAKEGEKFGVWEQAVMDTFTELQLGGDVLQTELVIRAADKMTKRGTVKFCRASARRALANLSSGKKSRFTVEEGYVFEAP